jgi:hypothetical protein
VRGKRPETTVVVVRDGRTIDRLATVERVVRRLEARLGLHAEFANVDTLDGHLALAVLELLEPAQTRRSDVLNKLIYSPAVSNIARVLQQ